MLRKTILSWWVLTGLAWLAKGMAGSGWDKLGLRLVGLARACWTFRQLAWDDWTWLQLPLWDYLRLKI